VTGIPTVEVSARITFTGEDSPMANLMLSVMRAFAEFERALIKERQREGIVLAKKQGSFMGRKKLLSQTEVTQQRQRITAGMSKAQAAREFGISRGTLYNYLKEAKASIMGSAIL
jgi:DNA invertase Pin-like site-specific DNA recombinase